MGDKQWQALQSALDRWHDRGQAAEFWLRDDDAFEPTEALERLCRLSQSFKAPLLLAIIPKKAGPPLAKMLADYPLISPAQHGYSHRNHASFGERAQELGPHRPRSVVLDELAFGHQNLTGLFGSEQIKTLVPPWNRMDEALLPELTKLGFNAISRFGAVVRPETNKMREINTHVDIIDWRNGRIGRRGEELTDKICDELELARTNQRPIGILTHHLVHDETAWSFLAELMERIAAHRGARWQSFAELRR